MVAQRRRANDQTVIHDVLRNNFKVIRDHRDHDERMRSAAATWKAFYDSTVVVADNVFHMLIDEKIKLKKYYSEIPRSLSPLSNCIVHAKSPLGDPSPHHLESIAILFLTEPIKDKEDNKTIGHHSLFHVVARLNNRSVMMYESAGGIAYDENHSITNIVHGYKDNPNSEYIELAVSSALYTFGFMNCKNVKHVDCTEEFTTEHSKRFRGPRLPELKWSRIRITAMPTIRKGRVVTPVDDDNRGVAFHIRKGNFAYYPESGKGLFGRGIYGQFWREQMNVGSKDFGTVIKDYEVCPTLPGAEALPAAKGIDP